MKLLDPQSELGKWVEEDGAAGFDQSKSIAVAPVRRKLGDISAIVASRPVDMLALSAVGIKPQQGAQLEIGIFLVLVGFVEIGEAVGSVVVGVFRGFCVCF